jgi:hypothetical protein
MSNPYYNHVSGQPVQLSRGSSSAIRAEFDAINTAFDKLANEMAAASAAADFKLIYQGSRPSDPTQRYTGAALQDGDLYFNSTSKVMKSFSGGQWYALITSSAAMLKDGGAFTGPISGTSASFSSSVSAAGFSGIGAGLTGFTAKQITDALGFIPMGAAGGTVTGQISGTTAVFSGSITAADFIMTSDERRKMKWAKLEDDILERFAAIKKVGLYTDKKTKQRRAGAGAQSMQALLPEVVAEDVDGTLGINYGAAATVLVHKLTKRVLELEKRLKKLEK